jgi:putative DNA primase/helicase
VWDGTRWSQDNTGEIERRAKDTILGLYENARTADEKEVRKALTSHALSSESAKRIAAMISLAKSEPGVPILPADLDTDIWAFNCLNGTIDLKSGQLRPHRREDLISKIAPVEFDPEARSIIWESFVDSITDRNKNLGNFLQRAVGYSMTGDASAQCIFILYGSGSNGKSTFLEATMTFLGGYAQKTPTETLIAKQKSSIPNDVARLAGARMVAAIEAELGQKMAEALIKQLTGGDRISARFLHREFFEFTPQLKLWLATNHKPIIRGTDPAIWRRIKLIPFEVNFEERGDKDEHLKEKLSAELPGILNWAVDGCLSWQKHGLGFPEEVNSATAQYRAEMDILGAFISDRCVQKPGVKAYFTDLYKSYGAWCDERNEDKMTGTAFGRALNERGIKKQKETTGHRLVYYLGLGLVDEGTEDGTGWN